MGYTNDVTESIETLREKLESAETNHLYDATFYVIDGEGDSVSGGERVCSGLLTLLEQYDPDQDVSYKIEEEHGEKWLEINLDEQELDQPDHSNPNILTAMTRDSKTKATPTPDL